MTADYTTPPLNAQEQHSLIQYSPMGFTGGWLTIWLEPADKVEPVEITSLRAGFRNRQEFLHVTGHIEGQKLRLIGAPDRMVISTRAACRHVRFTLHLRWEEA